MIASVSPDVSEALRATPAALSIFEGLPPSHRNEYLKWIASAVGRADRFRTDRTERKEEQAKRAEARMRRIAGMIDQLTFATGTHGQA